MGSHGHHLCGHHGSITYIMFVHSSFEADSSVFPSVRARSIFTHSAMRVPRNVEKLVWRSSVKQRTKNRCKLSTYFEYRVSAIDRAVPYTGKHGTVHSDIQVVKLQFRSKVGEEPSLVRRRTMKLTPKKAGNTDRLDLCVALPEGAGWGKCIVVSRVFGFHFLNGSLKLSKAKFQRPHPHVEGSYFYQMDHTNDDWRYTLAENLKIENWKNNQSGQVARRTSKEPEIKRRPAAAARGVRGDVDKVRVRKRPAAAPVGYAEREIARIAGVRIANQAVLAEAERRASQDPQNDPVRFQRSRFHVRFLAARALQIGGLSEAARIRLKELCDKESRLQH